MRRKRLMRRQFEEAVEKAGGAKEILEGGDRLEDFRGLAAHYQELQEKYPARWVAFYNGSVVATAKTAVALARRLRSLDKRGAIRYDRVVALYVYPKGKEPRCVSMRIFRRAAQAV